MKSLLKKCFVAASALLALSACEKEEEKILLNSSAVPVVTTSAQTLVLTKDNADKDALTVNWAKPNYGFDAAANYTVMIDKKGGDFTKAASYNVGTALTKTLKVFELNSLLLGMGIAPGNTADIDVKVQSALGGRTVLSSVLTTVKATTYLDKLDLSSPWGLVGDATAGGWGDGPDQPFYKTDVPNVFVAYVTLKAGDIKIRKDSKWDLNYGGSAGKLTANGDNIKVTVGTYKVTFNSSTLSYAVEKFSWGAVGAATTNGWNGPDQPLTYDPNTDQWFAVLSLKADEMKIRLNNDWGTNYGGAAGKLVPAGDNFRVPTAGSYLLVADFKDKGLKYTLTPVKAWGLVGDATAGGWGDGPDQAFTPDLTKDGLWNLNGVKLKVGDIKVRADNKWDTNYGDDGANGTLEANGANIKIAAAGTYDVMLDFTNAASPKIKITKK